MPTNPSLVKLRAERKRLGMCRECGADKREASILCEDCKKSHREREAKRYREAKERLCAL